MEDFRPLDMDWFEHEAIYPEPSRLAALLAGIAIGAAVTLFWVGVVWIVAGAR
jgi:hypothetical protein